MGATTLRREMLKMAATGLFWLRMHDAHRLRIATFHSVQDHVDRNWHTPVKVFEDQMRYLAEAGYVTYTISELVAQWPGILHKNEKGIVITFDDGLLNNLTAAADILEKYAVKATFFISTENISHQRVRPVSSGLEYFKDTEMMSWNDLRELHKRGFEIGSHGHSHDMIAKMPEYLAREKVALSKQILESEVGVSIASFAYPYGHQGAYAPWTREMLVALGFRVGCTQSGGALSGCNDLLELPRIGIRGYDSAEVFMHKISGCYDFLRLVH